MDHPETADEAGELNTGPVFEAPAQRGFNKTAWLVIVVVVAVIAFLQNGGRQREHPLDGAGDGSQDVIMLLQCRYLVAAADTFDLPAGQFYQQASELNRGTVEQRLRFVVVAQEMAGAEEALVLLDDLDARLDRSDVQLNDKQGQLRESIGALMADYAHEDWDAPSVDEDQKALLTRELGWFGQLALSPKQAGETQSRSAVMWAARRTLISILGAMGAFCFLLLVGFFALVFFFVFSASGGAKYRFVSGDFSHAGIYAETFAVWICLFMLLSRAAAEISVEGFQLLVLSAAMFGSLSALVWPTLRGIAWSDVRRDIGWTAGRNPLWEFLVGGGSYAMTIPILFVGFLCSLGLLFLTNQLEGPGVAGDEFSPTGLPSHPIIGIISQANWAAVLQLYLVAAVAAPVVEETMFRGVMYRNLREYSARWGFLLSFLFSAGINSFIFAVIHPQGYVAVPVLMAIACGLTLAREWRGTLIPSIVAHGIHNGLLMTLLILAVGE